LAAYHKKTSIKKTQEIEVTKRIIMALKRLLSLIEGTLHFISQKFFRISALILGIMSIPIFIDVTLRFVMRKAIPGIIEIEEFMLVCIVFCSLALMQIKKEHVSINIVVSRLPRRFQNIVENFVYLVSAVLFALMAWYTIINANNKIGSVSFSLGIPISIFVWVAALGVILLFLVLLEDFFKTASNIIRDGQWLWMIAVFAAAGLLFFIPTLTKIMSWKLSGLVLGSLGMCLLFVLLFLKMPIGFAMALVGFLGMWTLLQNPLAALHLLGQTPYSETASFILAVAPLFIFMGELAFYSGMSQDLFDTAYKWFGRLPGGLSISSIAGCSGFAAVCGDSLATAVTMGSVALPEMRKKNYSPSLATGSIAAGGTLGILIPPSVGFIFYALITEESIGKLFIAGILPGILLSGLFILCIWLLATLHPEKAPRGEQITLKEKLRSLKGVIAMLSLFVLILGGILGGIFSPTEGGAIGAVGAFVYALFRRRINKEVFLKATAEATNITCKLIMILIGVGILGAFLAATRLPFQLADLITGLELNRYLIFGAIVLLYIILGCVLNVIPIILLTLPALFPTVLALNFDPIWFGVISVILMEMGQITPPIGIIVFAVSSVAKDVPMETIFKGIIPFVICMILCVIILTVFPQIALFLPNLLFK
jgi:tripartite ATP-independent transporter DctM subunit